MFEFVIKNGTVVAVATLIICLFGLLAIFRVPVQMIPDLDVQAITVLTEWSGATPQDIETEIIVEQEQYLTTIPGVDRIVATAKTGEAEIELEFSHDTDLNEKLIQVNNALSQVTSYPENVEQPRILANSVTGNHFMYFRIQPLPGNPKKVDMELMRDFIDDTIRPAFERVSGVAQAEIWGGTKRQVRIYVDPAKLAERHISLTELRQAIRARNRDVSGGDIDSGKRRYLIRTLGRFQSIEEIENLIITLRDGAPVYLRDVGYAGLDRFEIRVKAFANGRPNITLGIRKKTGANVMEIMAGVMAKMEELNQGVLLRQGLKMELTSEDVQYIRNAVKVVRQNLLLGAILASMVLYLFLRSVPATLLGAVGIPVCTIAAFIGLLVMGRTINVISLAGVAFAIGMTLDNSIVVLENIHRHLKAGKNRTQAALQGVREVWPAVLASTLTTVFVFVPVIFVTLEAGQLYSDIAIAISASIIMSMLVAITIVPSAACRLLPETGDISESVQQQPFWVVYGQRGHEKIIGFIEWLLQSLRRQLLTLGAVIAIVASIILVLTPKTEYLPGGEEAKIFSFMFAPPGYNLKEVLSVVEQMHVFLLPYLQDDPEQFASGKSDVPALNFIVTYAMPSAVLFIIETKDRSQTDALVKVLTEKFSEVPGMISYSSRGSIFVSNEGGSRSVNLDISGPELAPLFAAGSKVYSKAKQLFDQPQVLPKPSSLTMGQPLLEIRPDWERAAELGFNTEDLGYLIWAFSDGAYVDEFYLGDKKIDMFIYGVNHLEQSPAGINNLSIYSPMGEVVPLSSVARVVETANTETIRRVNGERTVTLSIVPPRAIPLEVAVERVKQEIVQGMQQSGELAEDIQIRISGASDRLAATRDVLADNFIVALLIAYLLMVAIFKHWGYPLIIMATVPLGISGGIAGLWLFNLAGMHADLLGLPEVYQPLDMLTMLGFLILIGTVVNNPILIVERTVNNINANNMAIPTAIIESMRSRLRPIIMSSVTTLLGLSPLVFLPGEGSELYRGIGIIVLFGLLFSTLVTLVFMPVLLSLVFQGRDIFKQLRLNYKKCKKRN